jgi:hypothetical protein
MSGTVDATVWLGSLTSATGWINIRAARCDRRWQKQSVHQAQQCSFVIQNHSDMWFSLLHTGCHVCHQRSCYTCVTRMRDLHV